MGMLRRVVANRKVDLSEELHPQTATLVNGFANALKAKLLKAQQKYGYSDNWAKDDWEAVCRDELLRHITKGDPLDVAAYCAFMWKRGWSANDAPPGDTPSADGTKALSTSSLPQSSSTSRIEALETALKFYADPRRYDGPNQRPIEDDPYASRDSVYIHDVTRDKGKIARAALDQGSAT
jgi:hypothetical protein